MTFDVFYKYRFPYKFLNLFIFIYFNIIYRCPLKSIESSGSTRKYFLFFGNMSICVSRSIIHVASQAPNCNSLVTLCISSAPL